MVQINAYVPFAPLVDVVEVDAVQGVLTKAVREDDALEELALFDAELEVEDAEDEDDDELEWVPPKMWGP